MMLSGFIFWVLSIGNVDKIVARARARLSRARDGTERVDVAVRGAAADGGRRAAARALRSVGADKPATSAPRILLWGRGSGDPEPAAAAGARLDQGREPRAMVGSDRARGYRRQRRLGRQADVGSHPRPVAPDPSPRRAG